MEHFLSTDSNNVSAGEDQGGNPSSDTDSDDLGSVQEENWLDTMDQEKLELDELNRANMSIRRRPSYQLRQVIKRGSYSEQQAQLILALNEVEGLDFATLNNDLKMKLIESLVIKTYQEGETIMSEGETNRLSFFFIVATAATANTAEVDYIRNNKVITRMKRGHVFGEKYFLTRQRRPRSATVRVSEGSPPIEVNTAAPLLLYPSSHLTLLAPLYSPPILLSLVLLSPSLLS